MKTRTKEKIVHVTLLSIVMAALLAVLAFPAEPVHAEGEPEPVVSICGQENVLPADGQWHTAQEIGLAGWTSGRMRLAEDMQTLELDSVVAEASGTEEDTIKADNVNRFNVVFYGQCQLISREGWSLSMAPGWSSGFYYLASEADQPQILNGGVYTPAPTGITIEKGDFICDKFDVEYFDMKEGSLTATSEMRIYGLDMLGGTINCDGAPLYVDMYTQTGGRVSVRNESRAGGQDPADIDVLMTSGWQTEISGGILDVYNETGTGLRCDSADISGGTVSFGSKDSAGAELSRELKMTGGSLTASSAKAGEALITGTVNEDFDDHICILQPQGGKWQTEPERTRIVDGDGNDVREVTLKKVVSVEGASEEPLELEETLTMSQLLDQIPMHCAFQDGSTADIPLSDLPWHDLQPAPDKRLKPDTEYVQVKVYGQTVQIPIEVIRYDVPEDLKAELTGRTGAQRAHLTWEPVEDATFYRVQRSEWQDMRSPQTIYADEAELLDAMIPGSVCYYRVQAVQEFSDGTNVKSEFCDPVRIAAALAIPARCKAELSLGGVTAQWDPVPGADEYILEQSDDPDGPFTDAIGKPALASDTRRDLVSLNPGSVRYYRVKAAASNHRAADRIEGEFGDVFFVVRPPQIPEITGEASGGMAELSWEPAEGAAEYIIERSASEDGEYEQIARTAETAWSDPAGFSRTFYYRVTAVSGAKAGRIRSEASQPLRITTPDPTPEQVPVDPTIKKPAGIDTKGNVKTGAMKIFFKPVKDAANYSIAYRIAGTQEWTCRWTDGLTEYTVKNLKKGQLLEFKFAAYMENDGMLTRGDYCRTSFRYMKAVEKASVKAGKKSVTVKVRKVSGASGYQVLYASNKKMTGAKAVTFKGGKKTRLKVSGLKKGKTYYIRYRPYKTKGGKIYYGVLQKTVKVRVK